MVMKCDWRAVPLDELEALIRDASRYRWLRGQLDRWPAEYNAPHVRISEKYDYAQSSDLDEQIDKEMTPNVELRGRAL